jgi:exodeoxyribonuclease VII large subunit
MTQEPLFSDSADATPAVYTVGAFLDFVNEILAANDFFVQGEVVSARPHPTGMYFSLKDGDGGGVMDCYMSPYAYRGLGVVLEDGMQVKVGGAPSIYKPKGRFSFKVETLEPVGEGSLKKAYEALKKKLTEEGLFERKRSLPEFIGRVGLITSKTGAVIDDFRRNLSSLGLKVYHRDVRVEGAAAVQQVAAAVDAFNRGKQAIDVLVVIRGGGSMEDLQAFNNEIVARAVFGSKVPTIVSIGHDRDVPLAQMAADASASTPTATAVLINASWERLRNVHERTHALSYAMERALSDERGRLDGAWHRLDGFVQRILGAGQRLQQRIAMAMQRVGQGIEQVRQAVDAAERQLAAMNPERQLRLGYSIVTDDTGAVIRSAAQLRHGQTIRTRLSKGAFASEVKELQSEQ